MGIQYMNGDIMINRIINFIIKYLKDENSSGFRSK